MYLTILLAGSMSFFIGLAIGLFLFDVLITRPMTMKIVHEHKEQLDKERKMHDQFVRDTKDVIDVMQLKEKNRG